MKQLKIYFSLLLAASVFGACKKDEYKPLPIASVNVVNASVDQPILFVYFTFDDSAYYKQSNYLYSGSNLVYSVLPGETPVTIVSYDDTLKPYFSTSLDIKPQGIYSLFLTGVGARSDSVFIEDKIPVYSDNVAGVRFINLCTDDRAFNVNLQGNDPAQPEIANLGYKQITGFISYSASNGNTGYTFEIRDPGTSELLSAYQWSFAPFKNYTIVIYGSGSVSAFQVNNF